MQDYTSFEKIFEDYVAELKELVPSLIDWSQGLDAARGADQNAKIWTTGMSGHPRFLAVYRKYYFAIEQLNVNLDAEYSWREPPPESEMWGKEDDQSGPGSRRHNDLLLVDAADVSDELKLLTDGLVFVPVGLDDEDYPV